MHSAALAYFMIFSLAPILLILISVLSLWLSQDTAQQFVLNRLYRLIGISEGLNLLDMINSLRRPESSWVISLIEGVVVVLGASNLFSHLRGSLNRIWNIEPEPDSPIWLVIRKRLFGLLILLGVGLLATVSVVFSTLLSALKETMFVNIPFWLALVEIINRILGFVTIWSLFAVLFKVLPDAEIAWKDLWIGSGVTTLLFYVGQIAIGIYIRVADLGSGYGAASSLIVLLVWVFYISQTFYFGAEFVEAYANKYGSMLHPAEHAHWFDPD